MKMNLLDKTSENNDQNAVELMCHEIYYSYFVK